MGADSDNVPSQVGLVSSVDSDLAQWPAASWTQGRRQEMLFDDDHTFAKQFRSRLDRWKDQKKLPENIIIFRDGVSEGQFKQVLDLELPQIREACEAKYQEASLGLRKSPKLCIIVSIKRHHTRFYPTSESPEERTDSNNIRNGTVVDRGVTLARYWEFFMTAHNAKIGKWFLPLVPDPWRATTRGLWPTSPSSEADGYDVPRHGTPRALRGDPRRSVRPALPRESGGRGRTNDTRYVLPIRQGYEGGEHLPACILRRHRVRARSGAHERRPRAVRNRQPGHDKHDKHDGELHTACHPREYQE